MNKHEERLRAMLRPDQKTWDLSPNDVKAIAWIMAEVERLREVITRLPQIIITAISSDGLGLRTQPPKIEYHSKQLALETAEKAVRQFLAKAAETAGGEQISDTRC